MKMMAIYANVEERVGPVHSHPLYTQPFLEHSIKKYEEQIQELEKQRYEIESKGVDI